MKNILVDVVEISANIVEISANVVDISGKLNTLSDNFDLFKGETNERLLRERVQKLYVFHSQNPRHREWYQQKQVEINPEFN